MQAWQAQVQNEQIKLVRGQGGVSFAAAADLVDRIARTAQRAQQTVGQHLIIFGDKNAHTACLLSGGTLCMATSRR